MNSHRPRDRKLTFALAASLVGIVAAVYFPASRHDFVSFDDPKVVYENPFVLGGINTQNLKWAFTTLYFSNWIPLTWISLQIDSSIWGTGPSGYHVTNILIHAISVVLAFVCLKRLGSNHWLAFAGALLFAIHPLNVQPVCWISERKGILSSVFWLSAVLCYVNYLRTDKFAYYLATACFLLCSLLSKQAAILFPLQSLVLAYVVDRSGSDQARILRLERVYAAIPWLIVCLAFAVIAYKAQESGGSIGAGEAFPLYQRFLRSITNCAEYVLRFLVPLRLQFHYHNYGDVPSLLNIGLSSSCLALGTFAIIRSKAVPLIAGWIWFLASLAPVSGIVQIAQNRIADRYMYIPMLGLIVCLLWIFSFLRSHVRRPGFVYATAFSLLCIYGGIAVAQIGVWRDSETLFRHAISIDHQNPKANLNLGALLAERGDFEAAIKFYRATLAVEPTNVRAIANLGRAFSLQGNQHLAIPLLDKAVKQSPEFATARCNLGIALASDARYDQAIGHFEILLEDDPENGQYWGNLGTCYFRQRKWKQALTSYSKAIKLEPSIPVWSLRRGDCHLLLRDFSSAKLDYESSIQNSAQNDEAIEGLFAVGLCEKNYDLASMALAQLEKRNRGQKVFQLQVAILLASKEVQTTEEARYVERACGMSLNESCRLKWHSILLAILGNSVHGEDEHSECDNARASALYALLKRTDTETTAGPEG